MPLTRVTITGADDNTNIDEMLGLSHEFPFVEWGILVSASQEGGKRFPSRQWIEKFVAALVVRNCWKPEENIHVSTHICGKWVRELLVGKLDWKNIPPCLTASGRVQINTHAELLSSSWAMFKNLQQSPCRDFIFQWDGVNNHLAMAAKAMPSIYASALFDTSGGAGIVPESWPIPIEGLHCGYAGGIGPHNVVPETIAIDLICGSERGFWIDMERRVRTEDDSRLDMAKVRRVLELTAPLVNL